MNFQIKKARELRQLQTKAESKLWQMLRNRNFLDLKFRRQHPIKSFIVDFCCLKEQLIIELDGESHNNAFQQNYDDKRTLILEKLGYTILRFENKVVFEQPELILQEIKKYIEKPLTPTLSQGRGISVLSTKKLTQSQKELFSVTNVSLQEYNAISIHKLPVKEINQIENAIVTSQNSAKILIELKAPLKNIFCVGKKTTSVFLKNNYNVVKTAKNAKELAGFIMKNTKNESFVFFCGNKRREELPSILSENNINFTEEILYKTILNPRKFKEGFKAVLFFSPSGVESYIQENSLENSVAFCIGNTTAYEAKKYTPRIVVAEQSTIENTITTAIDYFKS